MILPFFVVGCALDDGPKPPADPVDADTADTAPPVDSGETGETGDSADTSDSAVDTGPSPATASVGTTAAAI